MMMPRRAALPMPARMARGVPAATPHAPATMMTAMVEVMLRVRKKVKIAAPKAK